MPLKLQSASETGRDHRRLFHMFDDRLTELRAFNLGGAFHLASKIISDGLGCNRPFHASDDKVRQLPATQDNGTSSRRRESRTRVDLVQVGIFGVLFHVWLRKCMAGLVVYICPGAIPILHLGGDGVRQVVTVQVQPWRHIKVARADQRELQVTSAMESLISSFDLSILPSPWCPTAEALLPPRA